MLVVLNIVKGAFPEGSLDNIQVPSYQHASKGKGEVIEVSSDPIVNSCVFIAL